MAHVRALRGFNGYGFDEDRDLLVVPVGKTSTLYLSDPSVLGTGVATDDPRVAAVADEAATKRVVKSRHVTDAERRHPIRKLTVSGVRAGTTTLRAEPGVGADTFDPVTVRVVTDVDYRQSGDRGALTPEFRAELAALPLRQAVLRVAEDQMYSKIGRDPGGFGEYADKLYDWCGAFAWYCWNVACTAHNRANPFGGRSGHLLSCEKAVSYALQNDCCTILRYEGGDPYGKDFTTGAKLAHPERQEYVAIDARNPVLPADIVIVREGTPATWKHVALVSAEPSGDDVHSLDGNQTVNKSAAIARRKRSLSATVNNGQDDALIFLHVLGVDG